MALDQKRLAEQASQRAERQRQVAVQKAQEATEQRRNATRYANRLRGALDEQKLTARKLATALTGEQQARSRADSAATRAQAAEQRERSQRLLAEAAGAQAVREGRRAEQAGRRAVRQGQIADARGRQSRQRLERLYVTGGLQLLNEGDLFGSLLWFSEAQRSNRDDLDRQRLYSLRSAAILQQCPRLMQLWWHPRGLIGGEFSPDRRRLVSWGTDPSASSGMRDRPCHRTPVP